MKRILFSLAAIIIALNTSAQNPEPPKRMAVVQTSTCYMRLHPDYESALETQELMGTVVEIVGEDEYWREIISPQPYKAWVTEKTLVEMTPEQIKEYQEAPKYMFTAHYGHVYTTPTNNNPSIICDLVGGDVLRAAQKIKGNAGPSGKFRKWAEVILPSGQKGWVLHKNLRPLGERVDIRMGDSAEGLVSIEKIEDIIQSAYSLRGVPYLWGGMSSKGVDCSGLVRISFLMNDVLLPRNASQQIKCGKQIEVPRHDIGEISEEQVKELYDAEKANQAIKNLQRGDLIFFGNIKTKRITHVGIYLGDGEFIHSSHLVRINSLIPGSENYYENAHRLIHACRIGSYSEYF